MRKFFSGLGLVVGIALLGVSVAIAQVQTSLPEWQGRWGFIAGGLLVALAMAGLSKH